MSVRITVQTDTTEEAVQVLAELERLRIRVRSYDEPTASGEHANQPMRRAKERHLRSVRKEAR